MRRGTTAYLTDTWGCHLCTMRAPGVHSRRAAVLGGAAPVAARLPRDISGQKKVGQKKAGGVPC